MPDRTFLGVLDGHWSTLIVRELLGGPRRFGELKDAFDGISPKTLTNRLRSLEDAGLLVRTAYDESPPRVVYTLTDEGRELARYSRPWPRGPNGTSRPRQPERRTRAVHRCA